MSDHKFKMEDVSRWVRDRNLRVAAMINDGYSLIDIAEREGLDENIDKIKRELRAEGLINEKIVKRPPDGPKPLPYGMTNRSAGFRNKLNTLYKLLVAAGPYHVLQLSAMLGVTQKNQKRILNNNYDWKISQIERLCFYLHIDYHMTMKYLGGLYDNNPKPGISLSAAAFIRKATLAGAKPLPPHSY